MGACALARLYLDLPLPEARDSLHEDENMKMDSTTELSNQTPPKEGRGWGHGLVASAYRLAAGGRRSRTKHLLHLYLTKTQNER